VPDRVTMEYTVTPATLNKKDMEGACNIFQFQTSAIAFKY